MDAVGTVGGFTPFNLTTLVLRGGGTLGGTGQVNIASSGSLVLTNAGGVVKEFKLQPDQYIRSTRLREWARKNKNSKYIPEPLLEAWGFEIESTL